MSVAESGNIEGLLDELKNWPSSERLRLARMILETIENHPVNAPTKEGSLKDLRGLLKSDAPSRTEKLTRGASGCAA